MFVSCTEMSCARIPIQYAGLVCERVVGAGAGARLTAAVLVVVLLVHTGTALAFPALGASND